MERWGRWESDKKYLCLAKFQPPAVPLLFGPVLSCPILFYPVPFPQSPKRFTNTNNTAANSMEKCCFVYDTELLNTTHLIYKQILTKKICTTLKNNMIYVFNIISYVL